MKYINLWVVTAILISSSIAQAFECEFETRGRNFTRINGGLDEIFEDGKSENIYACVDSALTHFNTSDEQTTGRYGIRKTIKVLPKRVVIEIEGKGLTNGHLDLLNSKIDNFTKGSSQYQVQLFTLNDDSDEATAEIKRLDN